MLSDCFTLIQAIKTWPTLNEKLRNRYFICAAVMVFTFLFVFVILKPTPDIEEFLVKEELSKLSDAQKQALQMPSALQES